MRFLSYLGRRAALVMALGVFIGLALPELASVARPLLTPTVMAMLTLAMLRTDASAIGQTTRRFGVHFTALVWLLVLSPLVMFAVLGMLDVRPDLAAPLLIWSGSPPLVSVPAIALILGLDAAAALLLMVVSTFAFPFVLPGLLFALTGVDVEIGAGELTIRLAILVAVCALAATILRRKLGAATIREKAPLLDGLTVLLMLVFAITVMDGVSDRLRTDPGTVLLFTGAAFAASLTMQVAGILLFAWTGRQNQLSVALSSGNRNMALFMAAAGTAFGPETMLFFAVVQFPIYILPVLLKPIYRGLSEWERPNQ